MASVYRGGKPAGTRALERENEAINIDLKGRTPPSFIAIEGPIGVGKTTLAKKLAASFNYDTLLGSIRSFDVDFVRRLVKLDISGAWEHVNGGFLLTLLLGIATSILSLARLISWVLHNYPVPLWAFFFGLILASALVLLRQVDQWNPGRLLLLLVGVSIALTLGRLMVISKIAPFSTV